MDHEIWKDIDGYDGIYQVSNTGKVKSVARVIRSTGNATSFRNAPERFLTTFPRVKKDGTVTRTVKLYRPHKLGGDRTYNILKLVEQAFPVTYSC